MSVVLRSSGLLGLNLRRAEHCEVPLFGPLLSFDINWMCSTEEVEYELVVHIVCH